VGEDCNFDKEKKKLHREPHSVLHSNLYGPVMGAELSFCSNFSRKKHFDEKRVYLRSSTASLNRNALDALQL
jgi:hypothetical protein